MAQKSKSIDNYISKAPLKLRGKLQEMRKTIKSVAPDAEEGISYMMPAFDNGRIAWFALMKTHIGLYLRPPIIEEHKKELAKYVTTKSAVHFPIGKKLPIPLIKKLIKARIRKNRLQKA